MQIIRLETNTSSAFPQRKRQPSLMSRVKLEYSYLFPSTETIEWFSPLLFSLPRFSLPLWFFSLFVSFTVGHVLPSHLQVCSHFFYALSSWNVVINSKWIGSKWCWQSCTQITPLDHSHNSARKATFVYSWNSNECKKKENNFRKESETLLHKNTWKQAWNISKCRVKDVQAFSHVLDLVVRSVDTVSSLGLESHPT